LEDVELQDSAHPYHNWNEKITEECYRQNAASRILGPNKKIIDIVNNYSKISFDFGPTLLIWLEKNDPEVYNGIIEADRKNAEVFSGHGAAIAQAYNHIIMPLANIRDKHTQVAWGIWDFEHHFGRKPEGMWLPETAVDLESLEVLAEHGIRFTILAPHQAHRLRRVGGKQWKNIEQGKVDTTVPYLCRLPSGRDINLFFYNESVAKSVSHGDLLRNGEAFAKNLVGILAKSPKEAQLAHIATDGETYGHHHRHADMALAYCLHYIEYNKLAEITVYGEYLEKFPPVYEIEISENTSWSCSHGIERWRSNCGCCYGRYPSGTQQWRAPLREAVDCLRERLVSVYETKVAQYVPDPWDLRNKYISVINDRSAENISSFLLSSIGKQPAYDEKVMLLKLLEIERNALLMYTSCGWFFDDICGIETVQIMQYAARAMQLAKEVGGEDFESGFKDILEKAPTNAKEFDNGRQVYEALIQPNIIDLNRVGAHMAVSSIFEEYPHETDVYCYSAKTELYERLDAGIQTLATGRATLESHITLERHLVDFVALYFGDYNLIAAVNAQMSDDAFFDMRESLKNAFDKGDITEVMCLMNISFGKNSYSLWHLFKDEQRRILYELLETTWQEIEASFRHIYEHNYTIMQIMCGMNIPLPTALSVPAEFIVNEDLCRVIQDDNANLNRLQTLADEADKLSLQLDKETLRFEASRKINRLMRRLEDEPGNVNLLETIETAIKILLNLITKLDLQAAQNVFFAISKQIYPEMNEKADSGQATAKKWVEHFRNLAHYLDVIVE
jgi:alpha-amylase/alpha-mannosidase (GH57 family)